jgi:uncharacterized protein YdgA (DUF945 family)
MKKLLLSTFFIAILALAAVLPYWFGVEAERVFHRQVAVLDSNNKFSVVESRFKRGWLSSVAETTLTLRNRDITVLGVHTIEHGPFPVSDPIRYIMNLRPLQALIHSKLSLPGTTPSGAVLATGTLTTSVNIDSTTNTLIDIPPADTQLPDAATLAWKRISGRVDFELSRASWQGNVNIGGVDWWQRDASLSVGESSLRFQSYPGSTGLAMGNSTLSMESLRGHIPGMEQSVDSTKLVIESTAVEQGQNVGYTISGTLASAVLPALEVSGGNWSLAAQDLDLDILTDLNGMDIDTALPLNKLIALVAKRNAILKSTLNLVTDSGPVAAAARVQLSGNGKSPNPLMLIGALQGDIELEMPATVAELAARSAINTEMSKMDGRGQTAENLSRKIDSGAVSARIQSWIDSNMLTVQGDRYRFHASINNGSLRVNDKPFDFTSLLR